MMYCLPVEVLFPQEDMDSLSRIGVGKLFAPGAPMEEIATYIKNGYLPIEHFNHLRVCIKSPEKAT
jgi:hypothetical protein